MTVGSPTSRVSYSGNGSTVTFAVSFYFLQNSDLQVYLRNTTTLAETLQTLGSQYSLSGAGNEAGGSCTFVTAPPSGNTVVIYRDPPLTQTTDYNDQDPFPADSHETALDKLTMLMQRIFNRLLRVPSLHETSPTSGLSIAEPAPTEWLRWNSDGTGIESTAAILPNGTYAIATQSDAEAGVLNNELMTPLRTKQHVDARISTQSDALAGTRDDVLMTPLKVAEVLASVTGVNLQRIVIPSDFVSAVATFPNRADIFPVEVRAPGDVRMSKSPRQFFEELSGGANPSTSVWVSTTGNDAAAGTEGAPLLTAAQAVCTNLAPNVFFEPGTYSGFEFRTDTSVASAVVKRVCNARSGSGRPVIFTVTGMPVLSAATWTASAGTTNLWETTLSLSGSAAPHRVLFTDRSDVWGKPDRLTKYASKAALDAAGSGVSGWFFDSGTKKLYINFFGLSVEANKAKFRALYVDANNNARILLYGGVFILFDGVEGDFVFDGISATLLNNGAGVATLGMQGVTIQYANDNGTGLTGGVVYASCVRTHASLSDGFNYNPVPSGSPAFGIEHNCFITMCGDITTFGTSGPSNCQPSSAHGGGNVIRAGGFYADSWGQAIADTTDVGYNSLTWNVGVVCQKSHAAGAESISNTCNTATGTRKMWCDSCRTIDEAFSLLAGAAGSGTPAQITTKYVNCEFNVPPTTSGGATITTYSRNSP